MTWSQREDVEGPSVKGMEVEKMHLGSLSVLLQTSSLILDK